MVAHNPLESGGNEARFGLGMMPTFPRSPLSFRTAGFPQYGWRAGISDQAFPPRRTVQASSQHTLSTRWLAFALRASRRKLYTPARSRGWLLADAPPWRLGSPPPQGSSLGTKLCCLGPSSLNRPPPPHSRAPRDFAARRLIREVCAVRERTKQPPSGSGLSLIIPSWHAVLHDPGEFGHRYGPVLRCRLWPSPRSERLGTPDVPAIRFTRGSYFVASRFAYATACQVARPPLTDRTGSPQPQRAFTPGLTTARSPSPPPGITTTGSGLLSVGGTLTRRNDSYPRCTRSGRAGLPHPALASGDNAEAAQRGRMMDVRRGQPAVNKPQRPVPQHPAVLAAPRQGAMPEPDHLEPYGPGIQPRKDVSSGCRRCKEKRKATPNASPARDALGSRVVGDPVHVRKHLAREPGDPVLTRT